MFSWFYPSIFPRVTNESEIKRIRSELESLELKKKELLEELKFQEIFNNSKIRE